MPNELGLIHVAALHNFASGVHSTQDYVYAIRLLEIEVRLGDPFYTPFALALLANCYKKLGQQELEYQLFKRVVQLPREQQELLNPRWLAACYERVGDFKTARTLLTEMLRLKSDDPFAVAGLVEVSLFEGASLEAMVNSLQLKIRPEPQFQILGRILGAFSFALQDKHNQAKADLVSAGQILATPGILTPEFWDYRDLYRLLPKMGPNADFAKLLLDALDNRVPIPEFVKKLNEFVAVLPEALPGN